MSFNIVDEVTKKLQVTSLSKVDPNTQAPVYFEKNDFDDQHRLKYVAIPTVLVAIYKHTRNEEDTNDLFSGSVTNPSEVLFGDHTQEVISQVATNAQINEDRAVGQMNETFAATKTVIKDHVPDMNANKIVSLFTDQRSVILKHLPARLNLGEIMNDGAVDDRTNKMEGPASGLMHAIEKIFSSTK